MRWLWIICNKLYKNISKTLTIILFFFLSVVAICFSAQYIGEQLAGRFLENKSVRYVLAYDKNNRNINQLFYRITKNKNLKDNNFKFFKTFAQGGLETRKGKFDVIVADNKDVIESMVKEGIIGAYPQQIIPQQSKKYVRFSKYGEYIIARTNDNIDVYVAIASDIANIDEAKIFKSLQLFGEEFYRKISPDPYYEEDFDKELEKEKEQRKKEIEDEQKLKQNEINDNQKIDNKNDKKIKVNFS